MTLKAQTPKTQANHRKTRSANRSEIAPKSLGNRSEIAKAPKSVGANRSEIAKAPKSLRAISDQIGRLERLVTDRLAQMGRLERFVTVRLAPIGRLDRLGTSCPPTVARLAHRVPAGCPPPVAPPRQAAARCLPGVRWLPAAGGPPAPRQPGLKYLQSLRP